MCVLPVQFVKDLFLTGTAVVVSCTACLNKHKGAGLHFHVEHAIIK